jgi:hypothetical protein
MNDDTPTSNEKPEGVVLKWRHLIGVAVVVSLLSAGSAAWATHDFPDVPASNPFHDEISWMADTGITTGFPDGGFHPSEPVSRQAMSAFMQRLFQVQAGLTSVDTGTDGGSADDNNTGAWENVSNASTSVTIPPGTRGRIITTFSGDLFCNSGDNIFVLILVVRPQCLGRVSISGAGGISSPTEVTLADSDDAAGGDAPDAFIDSDGFSMTTTSGILNPGTYTVTPQYNTADNNPASDPVAYEINDFILTATVALDDTPPA